ncbi:OLC1v1023580C1 [Oldenlandia corymbosa var. corymbosa]|uniref:OLC1v1023580C1 n=1 Tax=Oldenlandia corymbosa var. corymbosa TaxID=529605 RepID=A0AAV1C329_OLDCO|nr:OLC1v1023580C1 [Oldenlandia corymbosa var. corymbosa]
MESYKPKNILITGAAGFIACHVANRLIRTYPDYHVVVLDKLDYCSNLKNLKPSFSSSNFKFIKGDIGSADLVNYVLVTESIDTIMHFAAQTHVDNSFGNSFEFTKNNIYGTHVLLEASKKLQNLGWSKRTTWEEGLRKTMEWYVNNPDWWGDVLGALVPHPRMLMMPGNGKNISDISSDSYVQKNSTQKEMVVPAVKNNSSIQKPSLKFLIYGRTGWICGLLETIRTNVAGTLTLADVCREHGLLMLNFATGCIFEYDSDHPLGTGIGFKEEDKPNFTGSFYSKTKGMVEELLKEYDNVCTLRVRMPISADLNNPRNFITKITKYDKVVNIPNSMTVLDELLPIAVEMAKINCKGIWNFTNPGVISHNEILDLYRDYIDPSFKWTNFTVEEQAKVVVAPRSNNEMDATKLKNKFPELLYQRITYQVCL